MISEFASEVYEFRQKYGLTQYDLGHLMKYGLTTVNLIENGKIQPSRKFIRRFTKLKTNKEFYGILATGEHSWNNPKYVPPKTKPRKRKKVL